MSRKHYTKFAAEVAHRIKTADDGPERAGVLSMARGMIEVFEADNPRFDRDRFCIAAGIPRS